MRRLAAFALVCFLAALAAGCSTPSTQFYTLSPVAAPAAAPSKLSVAVGPVSVPATVDRPQIVVTAGPNQVSIEEYNRWASPLQDNLARVVAEDLAAILGTPYVTLFQASPTSVVDYRVQIEVRRFESTPAKETALDAVWTVRRMKDGKIQAGRSSAREPVQGDGFDAIAAAHSRAVAHVSQDIADAVRLLDRAAP